MPAEPQVKPLTYKRRTWFFRTLLLTFTVMMPVVVFYATGYRFDLSQDSPIVSTGGMYVSVPVEDTEIYINEELVRDIRVFRRASYIQNLDAGMHRLHVQGPGVQTWVKELPVRAHIVTEVEAFNLPVVSHVRLISEWQDQNGESIYVDMASSTLATDFSFASGTEDVLASTTVDVDVLTENQEYEFVSSLFGTSTDKETLVATVVQNVNEAFTFADTATTSTSTATTTIIDRDMKLYEEAGEVYATWVGHQDDIPYYFCIYHDGATSTTEIYGEHVYHDVAAALAGMPPTESQDDAGDRICRDRIKIDRKWQAVEQFAFFPGSIDHVLLHLEQGLYVVEIDDRAWQNVQQLYPGTDLDMRIDGGRIYVKDRDYLLEVLTEIEAE